LKKFAATMLALSLAVGISVSAFAADGGAIGFAGVSITTPGPVGVNNNASFTTTIPYQALKVQTTANNQKSRAILADEEAKALYAGTDSSTKTGWYHNVTSGEYNVTVTKITADKTGLVVTMKTPTEEDQQTKNTYEVLLKFTANGSTGNTVKPTARNCTVKITGTISATVGSENISDVADKGEGVPIGTNGGVYTTGMGTNITNGKPNQLGSLDIRPGSTIKLYLKSNDFDWVDSNGAPAKVAEYSNITEAKLRKGKITLKKSVSKGAKAIDTIEFDSDSLGVYASVKFVEYFEGADEQDVDFSIYLAKSGSRREDTEVNIAGTMKNDVVRVGAGDDYIDIEKGAVIEPDAYVEDIRIYLGNGVYITTDLHKGKKYYGVALSRVDEADGALMDKYETIENVLVLKTVNLGGTGKIVSFDMDGSYYVYGANGSYLGLSGESLAYSDKYYFSTKQLTISASDFN